ncbi:MAG: DUF2332 family protein [Boseongicola sp.]|nr:DUF2332 family protein [Boseongicola sp.]
MTYDVPSAFRAQSAACAKLDSPFMERLMMLCAERLKPGSPVTNRVLQWPGDPRPQSDNVPLRLAGALHALKIEGLSLEDVYPPNVPDDETLWSAVETAIETFPGQILQWLECAPQTNEVRRSAVILPSLALVQHELGRPLKLMELGASGGLNLYADQFHLQLPGADIGSTNAEVRLQPDWTGPNPPTELPQIISRSGVDLNPLDPNDSNDRLRLLAYLWPDQPDRLERTRGAIDLATVTPSQVTKSDAGDWLPKVLAEPCDVGRFVFHTIAAQYFPVETKAKVEAALARAGAKATRKNPLAHLSVEADGGQGASVKLAIWPGGKNKEIARADFHGRWIHWTGL